MERQSTLSKIAARENQTDFTQSASSSAYTTAELNTTAHDSGSESASVSVGELRYRKPPAQNRAQNRSATSLGSSSLGSPSSGSAQLGSIPNGGVSGRFSRDEMNLAEFPLTVLSTRVDPKVKTLEFSDFTRHKSGETIERKWIITAADKFGLPTSTDDDVILGLIRMSMDDGFRNRKVYFTRYELLKSLRWSTEGRSYSRLTKSLDRLSGVRIRATNSFYDNSSKSYQTCNFGILDAYEINDHRSKKGDSDEEPPKSFFIWSEMLFDSFRAGYIKKLDLDLYFTLKSAVSRRLYRYLDKRFYFRSTIEMPLMMLAFEKLGLSRSYRYVSSIRQQIEPALEELKSVGFLSDYGFAGKGEQASISFCAGNQIVGQNGNGQSVTQGRGGQQRHSISGRSVSGCSVSGCSGLEDGSVEDSQSPRQSAEYAENTPRNDSHHVSHRDSLIEALLSRGISVAQARRLLETKSDTDLKTIERIVQYYDSLVETNDSRVSKSKVGFLYRAVESPHKFVIPAGFGISKRGDSKHADSSVRPEFRVVRADSGRGKGAAVNREVIADARRDAYREYLDRSITSRLSELGADELARIHAGVEQKMGCLRGALSEERFKAAVQGCVKEELVKALRLPDFSAWSTQTK